MKKFPFKKGLFVLLLCMCAILYLTHAGIASTMILRDNSCSNDIERRRDCVADSSSDATADEVTCVRVILKDLNMSASSIELIVGCKLADAVEHAQQLSRTMSLPQAIQTLVLEYCEECLPCATVASTRDGCDGLNLQLKSNF